MSKEKITKTSTSVQSKNDDWNAVHSQLQMVQKKSMNISSPEDDDEKEADMIARKVVSGDDPVPLTTESGGEMIHREPEAALGRLFYVIKFEPGATNLAGVKNREVLESINPATVNNLTGGSNLYSDAVQSDIIRKYGAGTAGAIAANTAAGQAACAEARQRMNTVYNFLFGVPVAPESQSYKPTNADLSQVDFGSGSGLDSPFIEGRNVVEIIGWQP